MTTRVHAEDLPGVGTVRRVELTSSAGAVLETSSLGASVVRLTMGEPATNDSVVLGLDTAVHYWRSASYFGATVGRFANRIGGAGFVLDGRRVKLEANEGANTLHGGSAGFHRANWRLDGYDSTSTRYLHMSPDGDMGFPGRVHASATYTLIASGGFTIAYEAICDSATIVNLANHAYFNLTGEGRGDILGHSAWIAADSFLPVRSDLIPTGELRAVDDSPFDLRSSRRLGDALKQDDPQLALADGFDHNFCLRGSHGGNQAVAVVTEPRSGRRLTVRTTEPGLQFYTGQMLAGNEGRAGRTFGRFGGYCLEAQRWPDAPNRPGFPSSILRPGERYVSLTHYELTTPPGYNGA